MAVKIYVKGNFFFYEDSSNQVWVDNRENALVYKNTNASTDYNILLKSTNTRFIGVAFSSINDEAGTPYASQSVFEAWLYRNIGMVVPDSYGDNLGGEFSFINSLDDFPSPVEGVITLLPEVTYYITATIDLNGDRLVGGENTVILGSSSENCRLKSTGLGVGVPLFYTEWTTPVRHVTFQDVDTAIHIVGNVNPPVALDWTGVNFLNVDNVGLIDTCDNFIYSKGAILNSQNLKFSGTIGTIGIDNSIFVGGGGVGNILDILSTCTITRRFRLIYSSMVVFGSTAGINVDVSATIPTEGYILDTINFSAGGTYLSGVAYTDNKTRFVNSKGIENTAEIGNYYMLNNATATTILATDTPVKVAGTTVANSINQKFTHSDNRLTYVGALIRDFQVTATTSLSSGNNNVIGVYVAKNGVVIASSEMYSTTSSGGKAESITCQTILELSENDYVEIWAENSTSVTDITVEYLNVICKSLN